MELQCGVNWTCKLDGAERSEHFDPEWLHALAPAAQELSVPEFLPEQLATVELEEVPAWLHQYQFNDDAPVDLLRKKPDSQLWLEVLTEGRSVDSLDDDDLRSLRYMAPGRAGGGGLGWGCGVWGVGGRCVGGTAAALQLSTQGLADAVSIASLLLCTCRPCRHRTQAG